VIDTQSMQISEPAILKSLGVPQDKADRYLKNMIHELTGECLKISEPVACYSFFNDPVFSVASVTMMLKGKDFRLGRMVISALKKSTGIAVFIGTAGKKTETFSKELMKEGHALEGLIVDLIGSEIAEEVAARVHKQIETEAAASGLHVTNRYSPGYCNWPVSDQQQLFELMHDNCCGVHLTPSSLMMPIKSVSGIIGMGEHVRMSEYACARCPAEFCIYRDKK
jgi:hypothetical protein